MVIVKKEPNNNGSHASKFADFPIEISDGWIEIPKNLESDALLFMPWLKLTIEDGIVTNVEDNAAAREAWDSQPQPLPEPSAEDDLLAMTVDHEYRLTLLELGVV